MRHAPFVCTIALLAATAVSGCRSEQSVAQNGTSGTSRPAVVRVAELTLPSGTSIEITLATPLTSETATVGTPWTGTVRTASIVDGKDLIPVGSSVSGTVAGVKPAHKGDRAMLELGLSAITVGDRAYHVRGSMESIVAGSTRARNLGAIGAAAAAGAVVGHAVGGSGKGTIVGGLVGAGAATGVVSQTRGWQVVLKVGTPLTFTTYESVAVRT